VKVRLLLDDISTWIEKRNTPKVRDWEAAVLNAHPNIELRLFNPWRSRSMAGRVVGIRSAHGARQPADAQQGHDRDNRAAILGGRNIGDEYFRYARTRISATWMFSASDRWRASLRMCSTVSGTAPGWCR